MTSLDSFTLYYCVPWGSFTVMVYMAPIDSFNVYDSFRFLQYIWLLKDPYAVNSSVAESRQRIRQKNKTKQKTQYWPSADPERLYTSNFSLYALINYQRPLFPWTRTRPYNGIFVGCSATFVWRLTYRRSREAQALYSFPWKIILSRYCVRELC